MSWNSIAGWRNAIRGGSWLACCVVLVVSVAEAAPRGPETEPPPDMLEFLGSWQTRDGQSVSPFDLDEEGVPASEYEGSVTQPDDQSQPKESKQEPTGRMRSRPRESEEPSERPLR